MARRGPADSGMAVGELLLALVIAVASAVGSTVPVGAWFRTRDPRFLLVAGAELCFLALSMAWAYGQVESTAPSYTHVTVSTLGATALASVLLLLSGLLPRRG